ncbi:hypothetical protein [Clostridium acidisoli]|nr:hypothetical protein [Clostridium acidisoli]
MANIHDLKPNEKELLKFICSFAKDVLKALIITLIVKFILCI